MSSRLLSCHRSVTAVLCVLGAAAGCFLLSPTAQARQADTQAAAGVKEWEQFPFKTRLADTAKLDRLSLTQLKYLRGILFAHHGRVFDERVIQDYVKTRSWYKPDPKYRVEILNATERENMDRIKAAEHKKHPTIEPGDLKFYRDQKVTPVMLGTHTGIEWRIMIAEVEAIHGKTFADEPAMQAFFDERYWYHRNPQYSARQLNPSERANLEAMRTAWKHQRGVSLSPGDMSFYRDRALPAAELRGLTLYELRLMRNEVYARHGASFRTSWLADHFAEQGWYQPLKPARYEVEISPVEDKNVATILAREEELRKTLSTEPVDEAFLSGLYQEDVRKLRNEIYARHGRRFDDPWLQGYFAGQSWYHADPAFTEDSLSPVERRNALFLREREKKLSSVLRAVAA